MSKIRTRGATEVQSRISNVNSPPGKFAVNCEILYMISNLYNIRETKFSRDCKQSESITGEREASTVSNDEPGSEDDNVRLLAMMNQDHNMIMATVSNDEPGSEDDNVRLLAMMNQDQNITRSN